VRHEWELDREYSLILGTSVAVKHYLRGEESIYYQDLYHLVKYVAKIVMSWRDFLTLSSRFLPSYPLPPGIPVSAILDSSLAGPQSANAENPIISGTSIIIPARAPSTSSAASFTSIQDARSKTHRLASRPPPLSSIADNTASASTSQTVVSTQNMMADLEKGVPQAEHAKENIEQTLRVSDSDRILNLKETELFPHRDPPKWSMFDILPPWVVNLLTDKGKQLGGKKAALRRSQWGAIVHNIPLEISIYLVRNSSYTALNS
jgi:ion channel-forming bestrophin family protein